MAIYRLLQKSAFEPDDIKRMSDAYERALVLLGLDIRRDDPLTETVAQYIIEIAQTGETSVDLICVRTLKRLGWRDHNRPLPLSEAPPGSARIRLPRMERQTMTRIAALERANECEKLALATSDPHRQTALRHMRQLWLTLAEHSDELGRNIDTEFDRLIAIQAEIKLDAQP
jgi:hypothetical protein